MGDRDWMYNGWASGGRPTHEWIANTQTFVREAFQKLKRGPPRESTIWCPCSKCENTRRHTKRDMLEHLAKYGTKDYTKWTYHTETGHMRDEVVRRCIEELDGDVGVAYMIDDFH
jgi:hypothetical protein